MAGLRDCDAGALARFRREGLRWNLDALTSAVPVPALFVLGDANLGSAYSAGERVEYADKLRQGSL